MRILAVSAVFASACSGALVDYAWDEVEGSLVPFFEDPLACACRLYFSDGEVQYTCSPHDDLGFDLTFYTPLPPAANLRGTAFTEVQLGNFAWPSSGFGQGAAEMEFGSEEIGEQVTRYREVFVWTLDVPAQRICSALDDQACHDLGAGRATGLRFTCTVGS